MLLVVIVIVANLPVKGAIEGRSVPINGLDCRHPRSVRTGSLSKICGSDNKAASEDVSALVLMYSPAMLLKLTAAAEWSQPLEKSAEFGAIRSCTSLPA